MVKSDSIKQIIRTLGSLGDDEAQWIEEDVSRLEQELGLVNLKLSRLMQQRKALRTAIRLRKSRIAPMQRIPPEVISKIFLWTAVRPDDEARYSRVFERNKSWSYLTLLRVCKRWRAIAMDTPRLWSRLVLSQKKPCSNHVVYGLEAWLARSGNCSLDLDITLDFEDVEDEQMQRNQAIIDNLVPHIRRCSRLYAELPPLFMNTLLAPGEMASPQHRLENLTLSNTSSEERIVLNLSAYPRLFKLRIDTDVGDMDLIVQGHGGSVRVIFMELPENQVFNILRRCPIAEHCVVLMSETVLDRDRSIVRHHQLRELTLHCWVSAEMAASFLDRIDLPSLQKLDLRIVRFAAQEQPEPWGNHLSRFLRRSRPPISEMKVYASCVDETGLIQCLPFLSSLKSLDVERCVIGDAFWEALRIKDDLMDMDDYSLTDEAHHDMSTLNVCPELTELRIAETESSVSAIAETVLSRHRCFVRKRPSSCKPLARLHMEKMFGFKGGDLLHYPGISLCVEAGLYILVQ